MAKNLLADISEEQIQTLVSQEVVIAGEGAASALVVPPERLLDVMSKLQTLDLFAANYLGDVSAVDRGEAGFEVVYQLFSINQQGYVRVKVAVPRMQPVLSSVVSIWPGANWMEREVFDLMGIRFLEHPCLERILLPKEFVGHPLRKDFKMQPVEEAR